MEIKKLSITHNSLYVFCFLLFTVFLWVIAGWNTDNADYENYVILYSSNFDNLLDYGNPGFSFINQIFNEIGFTFEQFHVILFGVIIIFLSHKIWHYSAKPILVLFIYFFTAFFADVIQLKNTIAILFFYTGLFSLLNPNEKVSGIKFILFNLIATSIHIGFAFYFIFILCKKKIKPGIFVPICIICSVFGHTILTNLSSLSYVASNDFLTSRSEDYLSDSSIWSVIICSCEYLLHMFTCKRFINQKTITNIDSMRFMNITYLLSSLIIASSINMTFFRLFRNMLLISSIFIVNGAMKKKKLENIVILIIYFVVMSFFNFWNTNVFDNFGRIFANNQLL